VPVFSSVFGRKALKIKRLWNFTKVYRHKYRRQCIDFCLKNALKLICVHLQFENFSGGTAPEPPAGGGVPHPVPSLLTPALKTLASSLPERGGDAYDENNKGCEFDLRNKAIPRSARIIN
jgi:hypothetical protein